MHFIAADDVTLETYCYDHRSILNNYLDLYLHFQYLVIYGHDPCTLKNTCSTVVKNVKSSQAACAHRAALISVFIALSQIPAYDARPRMYGASASRGVPVYAPAFAGTRDKIHFVYVPKRNDDIVHILHVFVGLVTTALNY